MLGLFLFVVFIVTVPVAVAAGLLERHDDMHIEPQISVVVDGCSGLDARVPRAFNLTVAIDNPDSRRGVCVGGDALVLYAGVPLATGVAEDLCVPPRGAGSVAVRAASGGVGMPGELARMMEDEMRGGGGVARLDVRVVSPKRPLYLKCKAASLGAGAGQPSSCELRILKDESDGLEKDINDLIAQNNIERSRTVDTSTNFFRFASD